MNMKPEVVLEIVQKTITRLGEEHHVTPRWDNTLEEAAIKWSHDKGKRCGRTALQFARHWLGQYMLEGDG
jgi:predicted AAA+ superfamily ATPase